jgi:uncharacterized iron-regulated protein
MNKNFVCYMTSLLKGTFFCLMIIFFIPGCSLMHKKLLIEDLSASFKKGTIISSKTKQSVTFEELVADLSDARVIYVGERHRDAEHHSIQIEVIKALFKQRPDLIVGMEMVDHSYQDVLDQWSSGELDKPMFLQKLHWYANWRFDFELYAQIFQFIKENKIRVVGLNIPFHIPPKIAIGGIDSLSEEEKKHLPKIIDTSNAEHRKYVEDVYKQHVMKGRDDFENFYQAQCVWEDIMAESIAENLKDKTMVVLSGNGHIIDKFGIPERAFKLSGGALYKTIFLAPVGTSVKLSNADFIWSTPIK